MWIYCRTVCWLLLLLLPLIQQSQAGKGVPPELYDNVRTRFRVQVGSKSFKLSCPVKSPAEGIVDGTMIRWTKNNEEIGSEWGNAQYKLLNANRDLKIRSPQLSDTGHYKCMAVNGFGHKEMEFTLEVFDPNHQFQSARESLSLSELASSPVWYNRNAMDTAIQTPVRLHTGSRLELSCPANGNPLPLIIWKKNGEVLNLELTNPTSAKFVINQVNVADSGVYSCRLENVHGSLDADFHVIVGDWTRAAAGSSEPAIDLHSGTFGASSAVVGISPPPAPVIDQAYNNTTVRVGHTAQFQCRVQWRKETPMIRWLRKVDNPIAIRALTPNATILHINDMHLVVLEQKNVTVQVQGKDSDQSFYINQLVIVNVQQQDSGRYFCVVTNVAGQFVYRSAYLEVVEPVRFSPMGDTPNIIIGVVVACMLTLVCILVLWLCCNGTKSEGGSTTFSSASTSSTSTTKCAPLQQHHRPQLLCSKMINKPPPPRIPLPMAPLLSPPPTKFNAPLQPVQHSTPQPHRHIWHNELGNAGPIGFHSVTMDRRYRPRPNSQHNMALHRTRAEDEMSHLSSHIYASGSPLPPSAMGSNIISPIQSSHGTWMKSLPHMPPPPPCHARPTTPVSEDTTYDQDPHSRFLDDEGESLAAKLNHFHAQHCTPDTSSPFYGLRKQQPHRPLLATNHKQTVQSIDS